MPQEGSEEMIELLIGVLAGYVINMVVRGISTWVKDVNYRIEIMKCDRTNIYKRLDELEKATTMFFSLDGNEDVKAKGEK